MTPEEQLEEEWRLERNRAYQKTQRDKKKVTQPEKPRKRTLEELAKLDRTGAGLTPEEAERLEAHRNRKKAALGSLGRLFMVSRSVCVRMMLSSNLGAI